MQKFFLFRFSGKDVKITAYSQISQIPLSQNSREKKGTEAIKPVGLVLSN